MTKPSTMEDQMAQVWDVINGKHGLVEQFSNMSTAWHNFMLTREQTCPTKKQVDVKKLQRTTFFNNIMSGVLILVFGGFMLWVIPIILGVIKAEAG